MSFLGTRALVSTEAEGKKVPEISNAIKHVINVILKHYMSVIAVLDAI